MAGNTEILIKRSLANNTPSSLQQGELAYSYASNTLFIGTPDGLGSIEIGHRSDLANLTSGTYGDATHIPIVTVDGHGTVTNVTTSAISTTLGLSSDNGSNTMSLLDGTLTITGGEGITTSIDSGTSDVVIDVDDTVVRSNTPGGFQTIDGVLNISGDLHVTGGITYTDVETIISQNSLIKLANNNTTSDVVDIGFYGESNNGTEITYTGLFRHAGDSGKDYYLFDGYTKEDPDATWVIDPSDASFHLATLKANVDGRLVQSNAFLASQGTPDGYGNAGYSFKGDGGFDTGLFSQADGNVQLWSNNTQVLNFNPSNNGVAFGLVAGLNNQSDDAVAIGTASGENNQQSQAIAIGSSAGRNGQGYRAVAIGSQAGYGDDAAQGQYSIAVGYNTAYSHQVDNSIALNASGNQLNPDNAGLYVDPIRKDTSVTANVLAYNTTTKEVVSSNVTINDTGITLANGTLIADSTDAGLFIDSLNAAETSNIVFYNTDTKELTYGTMADLRPDRIQNGSYYWEVDVTTGALFSDAGTYIADKSTSVIIGQNVDLTSTTDDRVAIGNYAGQTNQGWRSTAVGYGAGNSNQNYFSTAIGMNAGNSGQGTNATAVGHAAAETGQGNHSVAIGFAAANLNQGFQAVAIGRRAGWQYQNDYSVAVGPYAGQQHQSTYSVAMGYQAGNYYQGSGAVAIGDNAGYNYQSNDGIAIGTNAAYNNNGNNGWAPIAIGRYAGEENSGHQSIALGSYAGNHGLGYRAIAIGHYAGWEGTGQYAVAIGDGAGDLAGEGTVSIGTESGYRANNYSVAIGHNAGWGDVTQLGNYQIALGAYAAATSGSDNSIVLNASGSDFSPSTSGLFIKPVRYTATQDVTDDGLMFYNQTTGEVRYSYTLDGGSF